MTYCPTPTEPCWLGPPSFHKRHKRGEGAHRDFPRPACGVCGERVGARGLLVAALLLGLPHLALGETIPEPVALLQGLDKITARVSKFEAPVGAPVRFGTLSIRIRDCEKNPPEETPESAAFVEIDETRRGDEQARRLFSGWMFASSPALSALEHPVYDVNLLDCRAASGSPRTASGSTAGKDAR
jgi:hypothetical protein